MNLRMALLLLVTWLIAAGTWAQSAPSGPALVDSRDECVSLQGTWKPTREGWQAACEVPWSRADCLRLGGSWTEIAKASAGGRCFAGVSEFALAQQCMDHGGNWSPPPGSRAAQCSFESAKARTATPKAADAGKRCDSQKDCTYGCVYEGPPVLQGADVLGRCRPSNNIAGCFSMVESGRVAGSICVN
jgi:hypothetical protein